MKILKRILFIILGIVVLLLITALFVNKDYTVERAVVINKPKQEVFDYVKLLENQRNYNIWVMSDPDVRIDQKGADGTVGFVSSWEGEKAGKGEQQIRNLVEGKRIDIDLHFIKPMESDATAWMTTSSVSENATELKWGMQGHSPYPLNFMNLFVPKILGDDMDESLSNLKKILER